MAVRPSLIRDLIPRIEQMARDHPSYSQVHDIVQCAIDHMSARARVEENNQVEHNRKQDNSMSTIPIKSTQAIRFEYKNHRGETSTRAVLPQDMHYGTTPYHREKDQFFMRAWDIEREAERWFAMEAMQNVRYEP